MGEAARLRCSEVRKQLPDYLNGAVDLETAQLLRWHFSRCKNCRLIVRSAINTFREHFREKPAGNSAAKAHAA